MKQIAVIDIDGKHPITIINPVLLSTEGTQTGPEGCLSIGGLDSVTRFQSVTVRAWDANGLQYEILGEGVMARALQHEMDHLNGMLFLDRLSPLKRDLVAYHRAGNR
jgi:peptide deformylase